MGGGASSAKHAWGIVGIVVVVALLAGAPAAAWSAALPDGRAYEMVSPPSKNGSEIMPDSQRTRAAADGSALQFAALSGFADVVGMSASADYVSVRTGASGTNGWAAHSVTPPQTAMPFVADTHFMEPLYWGELSDDLTHGVFRSFSPVTNDPMVANKQNLYLRSDLRTPGPGSYQLLTACPACSTPLPGVADPQLLQEQSFPAGASQDSGHAIFESRLPLTADSTANPDTPVWNLFEWDHGTVRLAGVLPDGTPAPASQAGGGAMNAIYTPHTISADGSRIFFTVPAASCPPSLDGCGDLYLRSDHATTVQLNASERTAADPGGPQPAQYWNASVDGSRAFFLSTESLTDDAPVNGDRKLYMYSVTPDGQGHHLTFLPVDHLPTDTGSNEVQGVIGASDDGHTVYFIDGGGQLVAGAPTVVPGARNKVFRWHDGTIDYVGAIGDDDVLQALGQPNFLGTPRQDRVSPDGRFLLFIADTGAGLTGYNHGSCPGNGTENGKCRELYLYRADATPHVVCVSCNPSRAPATTDATDVVRTGTGGAAPSDHLNHPLVDDGQHVFFSSGEALVPEDVNRRVDVYEYDVASGTLSLLSTGTDTSDSYFMDASRNGSDVFILTRQRLVGWDVDNGYDIYDVRVGGGFPEPVRQVSCDPATTCRGPAVVPPSAGSAQSESAVGSQAKPPAKRKTLRCRRGYVRKRVHGKVRCVKAKKHKPRRPARHGSGR